MDPEHWKQVGELFEAALDLDPAERAAYLQHACAGDDALYHEVSALLDEDRHTHSLLDGVAFDALSLLDDLSDEGKKIGPYVLVRRLGTGGMGAVYLAERSDGAFEQRVALKLIKRGMDSEQILRRFRSERQILARLEHPHIARLLDGGLTRDDQPYFVMEYVDGVPIDAYCDAHRLSVDERLSLFQDVCKAVLYAHHNLVVHRDLKPENILVTDQGAVKLLDFGIAKVLTDESDPSALTGTGRPVMTPEYASPEQVRGEPVNTSTDIYSLGVVLYELLAGHRPYVITSRSPVEIARVLGSTEPEKPSTAAGRTEEGSAAVSATPAEMVSRARQTDVGRLRRRLSGDLDTICLKALKKEPERRYGSVEALEEDLRRHVSGLPVLARRDTVGYRVRKFVARHRMGVAATALVGILLGALVGFYTLRLEQERNRVQLEADKAEQVIGFIEGLFEHSDPSQARGDTLTVREVMGAGAARLEEELADQPAVRARMMQVIGRVYKNLALYDEASPLLEQAVALQRQAHGVSSRELAASLFAFGEIMHYQNNFDAADSLYRQTLALQRGLYAGPHLDVAATLDLLSRLERDRPNLARSESLLTEALAMRRALVGDEHPDVAESLQSLALLRSRQGDHAGAEQATRETLALRRKLLGAEHPEIPELLHGLGSNLHSQGKYDEAGQVFREGLDIVNEIFGADHLFAGYFLMELGSVAQDQADFASADSLYHASLEISQVRDHALLAALNLNNLATLRLDEERYAEAETLVRDALQRVRSIFGEQHHQVAARLYNLGNILSSQDRREEANTAFREALGIQEESMGPTHPATINTKLALGATLTNMEQLDEAESLLREGLATLQEKVPSDASQIAHAQSLLGALLTAHTRYQEAELMLMSGYEVLLTEQGAGSRRTRDARERLVALYEAWDKPDKAARYNIEWLGETLAK